MQYDSWASGYDDDTRRFGWCAPAKVVEAVSSRIAIGSELRVLDLGVGTGQCSAAFLDAGASVVGVDASEPMLVEAARRGSFARLEALTLGEGSLVDALGSATPFDVVMACGVLHFVADLGSLLADLRVLTRPGAIVSITTIPPQPRTFGATTTLHPPQTVQAWLEGAGLSVAHQEGFVAYHDQGNPDDPVTYTLTAATRLVP